MNRLTKTQKRANGVKQSPLLMPPSFVERQGQKVIVIGEKGEKIKQIGIDARQDMEKNV